MEINLSASKILNSTIVVNGCNIEEFKGIYTTVSHNMSNLKDSDHNGFRRMAMKITNTSNVPMANTNRLASNTNVSYPIRLYEDLSMIRHFDDSYIPDTRSLKGKFEGNLLDQRKRKNLNRFAENDDLDSNDEKNTCNWKKSNNKIGGFIQNQQHYVNKMCESQMKRIKCENNFERKFNMNTNARSVNFEKKHIYNFENKDLNTSEGNFNFNNREYMYNKIFFSSTSNYFKIKNPNFKKKEFKKYSLWEMKLI